MANRTRPAATRMCKNGCPGSLFYDSDISAAEIWDYYQEHAADLQTPAHARWEQLTLPVTPGVDPRDRA